MYQNKTTFGGKGLIGNISESKRRQAGRAASGLHIEPLESRLLFSTFTVTSLADDGGTGELRWAIGQANAAGGTNTINFKLGLAGTITLKSGQLEVAAGNLTIDGPSAGSLAISGNNSTRVFQIDSGATTISNLTITKGYSYNASGGGILINGGTLILARVTLSNNKAGISNAYGGGFDNEGGIVDAFNTTVFGNTAYGNGGINYGFGSGSLTNCTIVGNTDTSDFNAGGLGIDSGLGLVVRVANCLIAGNHGPTDPDVTGDSFTSEGHNLIGIINVNGRYGNCGFTAADFYGTIANPLNADVGALANNGGPTETVALLAGSSAINAGSNALALDANGKPLTTDQRGVGFARIASGTVDIGAYEVQAAPHLVFHTQPTNGTAGSALAPVVVYIENSANSVITTDNSTVTISVNTGPAALTVKVAAKNGIATFSNDLIFDVSGTYTLAASDGTDKAAVSSSFVIGTAAAAKLVFATAPTNSIAGNYYSPPVVVYVEDAFSNIVRNVTTAVTLSVSSGPGKVFGVTTMNLSNGAAIFSDVWFQTAGVYKLTAKDGTLTPIISPAFTISPAAPAKLVFTTLPTTAKHGVAFTVKVSVEDGFGNIVTAQTGGTVSLTLATHPASSVLGGTLTTNIVAGVATFNNLTVSLAGTYSLLANNSFGLPTTTSNSFVVS